MARVYSLVDGSWLGDIHDHMKLFTRNCCYQPSSESIWNVGISDKVIQLVRYGNHGPKYIGSRFKLPETVVDDYVAELDEENKWNKK